MWKTLTGSRSGVRRECCQISNTFWPREVLGYTVDHVIDIANNYWKELIALHLREASRITAGTLRVEQFLDQLIFVIVRGEDIDLEVSFLIVEPFQQA